MSLTNEERQTLVRRELEKAHEAYEDIVTHGACPPVRLILSLLLRKCSGEAFLSHRSHRSHGFLRYCFGGLQKICYLCMKY